MPAAALDTNLLLLFLVGSSTGQVVGKRLRAYTRDDIPVLLSCLEGQDRLITTPNVWSEVSNVWDWGVEEPRRSEVYRAMVSTIGTAVEIIRPSRDVLSDPEFPRLGLTDCVWLAVLDTETTLITDDLALCNIALSRGFRAVNFTELRDFD